MPDPERNKKNFQRYIDEVFNGKDYAVIDELIAEDAVDHSPLPGQPDGRAGFLYAMEAFHSAFPDLHAEAIRFIAEGDGIAAITRFSGTHQGEFLGVSATGRHMDVVGIDAITVDDDGRLKEHWGYFDSAMMMQQLGLAPVTD